MARCRQNAHQYAQRKKKEMEDLDDIFNEFGIETEKKEENNDSEKKKMMKKKIMSLKNKR